MNKVLQKISGLRGDVTRLRGDLDKAGLTADERASGIDIALLIEEEG